MKTKKFAVLLSYQEECIAFLEEKSREGWKLDRIGLLDVKFCECSHPLKYQIGYNDLDEEYLEVVKNMGYELIAEYKNAYIFASEDLDSPDLETDYQVEKQIMLNQYRMMWIIVNILFGLFLNLVSYVFIKSMFPLTKAEFYLFYQTLSILVAGFGLGVFLIAKGILMFIKRRSIQNDYSFYYLRKIRVFINRLIEMDIILMGLSILFASLYSFHTMILFALILGVYLLKTIVNDFALPKVTYQKRKNILSVALFIVNLIVLGLLVYKSDQLSSLKFSTYDGEVSSYSNFYVNSLEINPDNLSNNNQLYYECRNDEVAQTLFEYVIIETERQKRISDDETIGLSFGEALARYQKYDSKVFEDCYRIGNFIVARNGNIVVRIVVEDVDKIDYVLESYLNF